MHSSSVLLCLPFKLLYFERNSLLIPILLYQHQEDSFEYQLARIMALFDLEEHLLVNLIISGSISMLKEISQEHSHNSVGTTRLWGSLDPG
jgi:hypothetical protein